MDVEFTRGKQIVARRNVLIGRMPVMLRSSHCVLNNKSEEEVIKMNECPIDPGSSYCLLCYSAHCCV